MAVFEYPLPITASPLIFVGFCFLFVVWKSTSRKRTGAAFPRGPTPLPILGNLRDFPITQPWITYTQWKEQYGMLSI